MGRRRRGLSAARPRCLGARLGERSDADAPVPDASRRELLVNGTLPVKDSALVSAGGELRIANGVALLAKFDGEFAGRSNTYAGTGTIRYRW